MSATKYKLRRYIMAVITISRGSHSRGKEVAEKLAKKLGYECISREVILEASEDFNVPEVMLLQAVYNAPSVLGRFIYGKERYRAFIDVALFKQFRKNNIVYHGFAGHFFVRNVPHALKVRIIANLEDRIKLVMSKEDISRKDAIKFLERLDEERVKWGQYFYSMDTRDPHLYDMVINIDKLSPDDAVHIIHSTVNLKTFETTPASQQIVEDLYLSALVKLTLAEKYPDAEVSAQEGVVSVSLRVPQILKEEMKREVETSIKSVPGVKDVKIQKTFSLQYEL
jgi:cytidylate kinase